MNVRFKLIIFFELLENSVGGSHDYRRKSNLPKKKNNKLASEETLTALNALLAVPVLSLGKVRKVLLRDKRGSSIAMN